MNKGKESLQAKRLGRSQWPSQKPTPKWQKRWNANVTWEPHWEEALTTPLGDALRLRLKQDSNLLSWATRGGRAGNWCTEPGRSGRTDRLKVKLIAWQKSQWIRLESQWRTSAQETDCGWNCKYGSPQLRGSATAVGVVELRKRKNAMKKITEKKANDIVFVKWN